MYIKPWANLFIPSVDQLIYRLCTCFRIYKATIQTHVLVYTQQKFIKKIATLGLYVFSK